MVVIMKKQVVVWECIFKAEQNDKTGEDEKEKEHEEEDAEEEEEDEDEEEED
jgi:ribosomal protein L12E/L44/L45/RPP1/RPP2